MRSNVGKLLEFEVRPAEFLALLPEFVGRRLTLCNLFFQAGICFLQFDGPLPDTVVEFVVCFQQGVFGSFPFGDVAGSGENPDDILPSSR